VRGRQPGGLIEGIREEGIHAGLAAEGMVDATGIEPVTPSV